MLAKAGSVWNNTRLVNTTIRLSRQRLTNLFLIWRFVTVVGGKNINWEKLWVFLGDRSALDLLILGKSNQASP